VSIVNGQVVDQINAQFTEIITQELNDGHLEIYNKMDYDFSIAEGIEIA
jgi:hypothetical protein